MRTQEGANVGRGAGSADPKLVVLVGEGPEWQPELAALLSREGYANERVPQLDGVVPLLESGAVQALLVASRPFAATDLLLLRRIRERSPHTAVVVVTKTPTDPDLKRAFESGATAFLSWPASNAAVRHAIDWGALRASCEVPPMKARCLAPVASARGTAVHSGLHPSRRPAPERLRGTPK